MVEYNYMWFHHTKLLIDNTDLILLKEIQIFNILGSNFCLVRDKRVICRLTYVFTFLKNASFLKSWYSITPCVNYLSIIPCSKNKMQKHSLLRQQELSFLILSSGFRTGIILCVSLTCSLLVLLTSLSC